MHLRRRLPGQMARRRPVRQSPFPGPRPRSRSSPSGALRLPRVQCCEPPPPSWVCGLGAQWPPPGWHRGASLGPGRPAKVRRPHCEGAGEHSVHRGGQPQPKIAFARPFCGVALGGGRQQGLLFSEVNPPDPPRAMSLGEAAVWVRTQQLREAPPSPSRPPPSLAASIKDTKQRGGRFRK